MSNELSNIFPVTAESFDSPCVDMRKLHEWLGVGKDFTNWVKGRIEKYDFQQGVDFDILLANSGEQVQGGHNRKSLSTLEFNGYSINGEYVFVDKDYLSSRNTIVTKSGTIAIGMMIFAVAGTAAFIIAAVNGWLP